MNKKIIGILVLIGLITVAILAFSGPKKGKGSTNTPSTYENTNNKAQTPQGTTNNQANSNAVSISLTATPPGIKAAGQESDLSKVEKSVINVQYKNNTKEDMNDVKVYVNVTGGKYEMAPFPANPIDQEATKASGSFVVFSGPSVKAGELKSVLFYLFSREAQDLAVTAEIRQGSQTSKSSPLTLQIN